MRSENKIMETGRARSVYQGHMLLALPVRTIITGAKSLLRWK